MGQFGRHRETGLSNGNGEKEGWRLPSPCSFLLFQIHFTPKKGSPIGNPWSTFLHLFLYQKSLLIHPIWIWMKINWKRIKWEMGWSWRVVPTSTSIFSHLNSLKFHLLSSNFISRNCVPIRISYLIQDLISDKEIEVPTSYLIFYFILDMGFLSHTGWDFLYSIGFPSHTRCEFTYQIGNTIW